MEELAAHVTTLDEGLVNVDSIKWISRVGSLFRLLHTENNYCAVSGRFLLFGHIHVRMCCNNNSIGKDRVEKKEEEEKEKRWSRKGSRTQRCVH